MSKTMDLNKGDLVQPTDRLCELRPELVGKSGRVEQLVDGDEVVVEFDGRRLYHVSANLVQRNTG